MGAEVRTLQGLEAGSAESQQEGPRVGADAISKGVQLFNACLPSMASTSPGAAALD